jgi:hypothetical protein
MKTPAAMTWIFRDLFRLALDVAQTPAHRVVYLENTRMLARIAVGLGIRGILHTDYRATAARLASSGLPNSEGGSDGNP